MLAVLSLPMLWTSKNRLKLPVFSSLPFSLVSWFSLNWLNDWGIEIAFGGKFKDDSM